jgi:hypothetical protein
MPNSVTDGQLKRSVATRSGDGLQIVLCVCAFIAIFYVKIIV